MSLPEIHSLYMYIKKDFLKEFYQGKTDDHRETVSNYNYNIINFRSPQPVILSQPEEFHTSGDQYCSAGDQHHSPPPPTVGDKTNKKKKVN